MDSKTIATIMVVFICVLLFPVAIGIIGGVFGVIGGIIGGIVGLIGGIFGAIFGVIGSVFGAIFGIFGWIFGDHYHWHGPINFFNRDLFVVIALVLFVVFIARSKARRQGR